MSLDPIYYNATRKLAKILEESQKGNLQFDFEENVFTQEKKSKPSIKTKSKIGVYKSLIIGKKGICFYCEEKEHTNKDHFFPKSIGGILIVHSCYKCNHYKGNLIPSEWIKKVEKTKHYSQTKKDVIKANTRKLLDKIINDGLERPFFI